MGRGFWKERVFGKEKEIKIFGQGGRREAKRRILVGESLERKKRKFLGQGLEGKVFLKERKKKKIFERRF